MREIKPLKLEKHYLVTVHRRLAEATFENPLSLYEQRILFAVLSNIEAPVFKRDNEGKLVKDSEGKKIIKNEITELPMFEMKLQEFGELLGLKKIEYRIVRNLMRDFKKKGIEVQRLEREESEIDERDYRGITWVIDCEYIHNEGLVRIELSPKLLPYVANLTDNFVTVPLVVLTSFKSKYSSKLYLVMTEWKNIKKKEFDIDKLKELMGVPFEIKYVKGQPVKEFKLDRYTNFKSRALVPAVEEINKHSDLFIEFEEKKRGKKVVSVTFKISKVERIEEPDVNKVVKPKNDNINSMTLFEYLAREVFGELDYNPEFYTQIAKALEGIPEIEYDTKIELEVYIGLSELERYFKNKNRTLSNNKKLRPGFIIESVRNKVEEYKTSKKFSFRDKLEKDGVHVEEVPDWFFIDKRKEHEANQPFTVIRKPKPTLTPVEPSESLSEPSEQLSEPSEHLSEPSESKMDYEADKEEIGNSIQIKVGNKIVDHKLEPLPNNPVKPNAIEHEVDEEERTKMNIFQAFNTERHREPVKILSKEERLKQLYEQADYLKAQGYK
jgi:hypothetical protein